MKRKEFLLQLGSNKSDWCPWGHRFDPWPQTMVEDLMLTWAVGWASSYSFDSTPGWEIPCATGVALKGQKIKKKCYQTFNIINVIYDKPTANIILSGEKLKALPVKSGKTRMPTLSTFIQHRIESPSHNN